LTIEKWASHLTAHVRPDGRGAREFAAGRRTRRAAAGASAPARGRGGHGKVRGGAAQGLVRPVWRRGVGGGTTAATTAQRLPALLARRASLRALAFPFFRLRQRPHYLLRRPTGRHVSSSVFAPTRPEEPQVCHLAYRDWPTPIAVSAPAATGSRLSLTGRSLASRGKIVHSRQHHSARPATVDSFNLRRRRGSAERAAKINARPGATGGIRRSPGDPTHQTASAAPARKKSGGAAQQRTLDSSEPRRTEQESRKQAAVAAREESSSAQLAREARRAASSTKSEAEAPVSPFLFARPSSAPEQARQAAALVLGWRSDGVEIHPDSALSCSALLVSNPSFAWMELFEE
jgi:hypothetical protein